MNESETIEFKKSLAELGEGLNSLAAILNKHGAGELWFGIKNDSTPVGMEVTETTLRKVSQAIAAHIEPKIFPEVSKVLLSGKACIRVGFSGTEKPYYSRGRAYIRVADEDRQLSAKESRPSSSERIAAIAAGTPNRSRMPLSSPMPPKSVPMSAKQASLGPTPKRPSKASASMSMATS